MPYNILALGRYCNGSIFFYEIMPTNAQKLQVLRIGMIIGYPLYFGLVGKLLLSQACRNKPFLVNITFPIVEGMQFPDSINTGRIHIIPIEVERIAEVLIYACNKPIGSGFKEPSFSHMED